MSGVGQNAKSSWRANLVRSYSNTRHHSGVSARRLSAKRGHCTSRAGLKKEADSIGGLATRIADI